MEVSSGGAHAVEFYKSAFGAKELFFMGNADSVVARLSIEGAEFWLSDESPEHDNYSPESLGGNTVRIILTVADPFGHHWEIGWPLWERRFKRILEAKIREAKLPTLRD